MSETRDAALKEVDALASAHFSKLHGPKMDGPRNDTERVLLDIIETCRCALNGDEAPQHEWVIKGPRGYFAADGAQSSWVESVDLSDAYGASIYGTEIEAQGALEGLGLTPSEKISVHVAPAR